MSRNGARPAPGRGRALKGKRRGRPGDGLEAGLERAADGTVIGQDPRSLTPPELRELGHRGKPLLQAMRRRCVDCCGGKADEVRRCTAVACPLWPYRMGTDPWHAEPVRPVARAEPAVPAAAPQAVSLPMAPPARATPAPHAAPAEPARAAADVSEATPSLAAKATAATSEPPAEPQKPAPTAPARRRRPVAQEPAAEPARGSAPPPAPQAPPPPHTTGRRRSRRPAEAPLLPFLDDAPA